MHKKKQTKDTIIDVQNLVKKYKKASVNAVDDISFYVEKGAFFALLGPNGAGKTTTISILTTTLSKSSGAVTVSGYNVENQSSQVRQNIGVIFQNPSLDLNLTAEENVRFHVNLYGIYAYRPQFSLMPRAYQKKVTELAEILGISKQIFDPVKSLSGGMKRKLEIIRSLTHNPKVLFLDEPTTGLDPVSRKNLWQYLQTIQREKQVTIFLTTHYLEEAENADYICIINNGKIVSQGTPGEIKKDLIHQYIVVDAKDREKLKKELVQKKFTFSQDGPFEIILGKKSSQDIIHSIKTPLTILQIYNPTLEDAYVEIIKNNE